MTDRDGRGSGAPPKSAFARTKKLLSLAGQMGRKEVSTRMQSLVSEHTPLRALQTQIDQATLLVNSLSHLKGAAMKAGQLLCIEGADFLPPEVIQVLSRLQDQAAPVAPEALERVLAEDLGADWPIKLMEWQRTPFASASIGQVHAARVDGRPVAVKVQYPGIADTIDSDLQILGRLLGTFLTMTGRQIDTKELFRELAAVLNRETDYLLEAQAMGEFRAVLASRPGYAVPEPLTALTTRRVLTMSFEEGLKLSAFLAQDPPLELREHFGRLILDLYVIEFFEQGLVQTDPNFGNFLFRPERRELVVLDFGAVRPYSEEFRREYRQLLRRIRAGEPAGIVEHSLRMGLLQPGESAECLEDYVRMLRLSIAPFDTDAQPFDFTDLDYAKAVREAATAFTRQIRHSAPPHQILFLHRKLGGIFNLLKSLRVSLDLTPYWEKLVGP
jgi:aarF domain-containing kinase